MEVIWTWIVCNWAEIIILSILISGVVKTTNVLIKFKTDLLYRMTNIEASIVKLESCDDERKNQYHILFKGMYACLDGLYKQGANGAVSEARHDLHNYLFERTG